MSAQTRPRIASVCRLLPTPVAPNAGLFVKRRVWATAALADVGVLQPVPYLPVLRHLPSWARQRSHRVDGIDVHHCPMPYVPGVMKRCDGWLLARSVRDELHRMHKERPLAAVDAHFGYPDGVGAARVAEELGVPAFITIRGVEKELLKVAPIGRQLLASWRKVAGVIAVSHSLKRDAVAAGAEAGRIAVIHNAVDVAAFCRADQAAARRELGVAPECRLVVAVGHLVAGKGHHLLIDAIERLRRQQPGAAANLRLAIIGAPANEPAYVRGLQRLIEERGLAESVHLLGSLPQSTLIRWLQSADVFALATEREGCCNAVLEALAVGLPVVTTAAGDNAEFVRSGENGEIVAANDAAATAEALGRALERHWDRDAIARQLAAQVGSWNDVAGRVLAFMRERGARC